MSTTLLVQGLTCGHCVASVTEELTALASVSAVTVDLQSGGDSRVSVTGALTEAEAQAAIAEAGYTLVSFQQD